jgi:integrase
MASVSIDKRPNGSYRVRWREFSGRQAKQRAKHFDRKRDADRFAAKVAVDLDRGSYIDPNAGQETVADYFVRWSSSQIWRESTRGRIEHIFDRYVLNDLGPRPLGSLRRSDMQAWVAALAGTLAPATVSNYSNVVAMMFNSAVEDEVIARSPMRRLRLPRAGSSGSTSLVPLTTDQVHALANAVSPRFRGAVLAQAGLGLRFSELAGLTVDRIEFLRRCVKIDRQLLRTTGEPEWGPTKTPASNRDVTLAESVANVLAAHLEEFPAGADGLVFTNTEGRPLRMSTYSKQIRRARQTLELGDVSSHDLRHYAAAMLVASGCSVKAVQNFLGHATAAETLDTYGHLWPGDDERIRAAIDAAFKPGEDQVRTLEVSRDA